MTRKEKDMEKARRLRNLADRLMRVPVMYGTDQCDCDMLLDLARELEQRHTAMYVQHIGRAKRVQS